MTRTNTVIIGAGQAGLAASRGLTALGIDHVVLERGRVAERWHGRWARLARLLARIDRHVETHGLERMFAPGERPVDGVGADALKIAHAIARRAGSRHMEAA